MDNGALGASAGTTGATSGTNGVAATSPIFAAPTFLAIGGGTRGGGDLWRVRGVCGVGLLPMMQRLVLMRSGLGFPGTRNGTGMEPGTGPERARKCYHSQNDVGFQGAET